MNAIKQIPCESVADIILALGKLGTDPDVNLIGETPIRQGFGDGCVVVVHSDGKDTCVSFEQFDFDPDAIEEVNLNETTGYRVGDPHESAAPNDAGIVDHE